MLVVMLEVGGQGPQCVEINLRFLNVTRKIDSLVFKTNTFTFLVSIKFLSNVTNLSTVTDVLACTTR